MSTLEATRETQSGGTRFRTRLLALGALIAAAAAALILVLSGADHAAKTHPAIGTQARPYVPSSAVQPAAPAGYFRDPTTHQLIRVSTPGAAAQPPSSSRSQNGATLGAKPGLSGLTRRQVTELDQLQSAAGQLGLHPGVFGAASQR